MASKKYPVIDAQSAIKDYNKKLSGFKDIQSRMNPINLNNLEEAEEGETLDDFLRSNSLPNTFSTKASLAAKIGMNDYMGKPEQDKQIMKALSSINEKESETGEKKKETENKDREFGLKEKELSLKEKEIEAKKMPGADEIANSLMNKFNSQ